MRNAISRRLPIGAEVASQEVHFRVWAPGHRRVQVVFAGPRAAPSVELSSEGKGYFAGVAAAAPGATYFMKLDGAGPGLPDPASRFQPEGPRGPSQVVDPTTYAWRDANWRGLAIDGQVFYEMHIGTFTPEGTWAAAAAQLAELADLGITVLEIMPITEFPGQFGWSYDGTNLFAPTHLYGTPDELRAFVDEAHRVGLGVILDVVYNHLGRVGEQLLRPFSDSYFSRRHNTDWGAAVNFDDEGSEGAREFVLANVAHWIAEYHFDGLRIDATQAIFDESSDHILLQICHAARGAAGPRQVIIVGESEPQQASLLRTDDEEGRYGLDAVWNDDFHHAAMVRLTGRSEAYFTDYRGSAEEFIASAKWGFLFQGQRYHWQKKSRGTPTLYVRASRFINYLQNHDQLANSLRGMRIHALTSRGRYRAMTALLLLGPQTPLLFQGQEFAASTPFLYFNDCGPDEAPEVRRGRAQFLSQFRSLATREAQSKLPDPCDAASFRSCRLDFSERQRHAWAHELHRDLLRLRRDDVVLSRHDASGVHGATLGPATFLLRYLEPAPETRLLVVNFDRDLNFDSVSQPLIAPPEGMRWEVLWSSEEPRYGGGGTPPLETPDGWRIPGEAVFVLYPRSID